MHTASVQLFPSSRHVSRFSSADLVNVQSVMLFDSSTIKMEQCTSMDLAAIDVWGLANPLLSSLRCSILFRLQYQQIR